MISDPDALLTRGTWNWVAWWGAAKTTHLDLDLDLDDLGLHNSRHRINNLTCTLYEAPSFDNDI